MQAEVWGMLSGRLRTSAIGFIDDVNILIYGESIERNYQRLKKIHKKYIE
jgi:hypothetical protein